MSLKSLLLTAAIPASLLAISTPALAQTACPEEITTAETRQILTSTENSGSACDVTIGTGGTVTATTGSAIIIDSDNSVTITGSVNSENSNDVTGVELQGGNSGDLTVGGSILLTETYTASDTDSDGEFDGPLAEGSGRTGILISGAATSPFTGTITTSGTINIEGNDSAAFRLAEGAGFTGDLNFGGSMSVVGNNARGIKIDGALEGDIVNTASVVTHGQGASAIEVSSDLTGEIRQSGIITNTGYRIVPGNSVNVASIRTFDARGTQEDEDREQAGSAISIAANISNGVYLSGGIVSQFGSAPAILFDGNGNNISIGTVSELVDAVCKRCV